MLSLVFQVTTILFCPRRSSRNNSEQQQPESWIVYRSVMDQIQQSLSGSSLSIIIVLDTVTHYSSVGTVLTVSKFDKSKPVYYQWLHQPLYNKTQDTNCWYQLTSRPALNRTKPVNLLQRHKNTCWPVQCPAPVKHQIHFVLRLCWDILFVTTLCVGVCASPVSRPEPMKSAWRAALLPLVAHVSSICKYFQYETMAVKTYSR